MGFFVQYDSILVYCQYLGLVTSLILNFCNLFTIVEGSGVSGQGGGEAVGGHWAVNSVSSYDGIIRWPFVIR